LKSKLKFLLINKKENFFKTPNENDRDEEIIVDIEDTLDGLIEMNKNYLPNNTAVLNQYQQISDFLFKPSSSHSGKKAGSKKPQKNRKRTAKKTNRKQKTSKKQTAKNRFF
jgi:hypothetical protein